MASPGSTPKAANAPIMPPSTPPTARPAAAEADALLELRARGFVQQVSDEVALGARMGAGPVCFYAGFDPTAASLHVGDDVLSQIAFVEITWAGRGETGQRGHEP